MNILIAHNFYQQAGGEDQSFAAEVAVLREHGHQVIEYKLHNSAIKSMNRWEVVRRTLWNKSAYAEVRELILKHKVDIAHFNNTFPLMSPAALYAAHDQNIPVVASLRNFRLVCPGATLARDGKLCHDCLGKTIPWPATLHGCYRGSRTASAVTTAMLAVHNSIKTWTRTVNVFVALTEFSRQRFIEGGFPAERIIVKPNFVLRDPGPRGGAGNYAIFVGRLSQEKGIQTLLSAWRELSRTRENPPVLKIVGNGPLRDLVIAASKEMECVQWLGNKPASEIPALMGDAAFLVFPSEWYETFGRVAVEAYAVGTPVIASNLGAMAEIVDSGRTGLRFQPGDAMGLCQAVRQMISDPPRLARMRENARAEFSIKYTADINYHLLMNVYRMASDPHGGLRRAAYSLPILSNELPPPHIEIEKTERSRSSSFRSLKPTVIVVHNFYQQPGGEDIVFRDEADLLERNGHRVIRFTAHNETIKSRHPLTLAAGTVWSNAEHQKLKHLVATAQPQIVHFHNTFPLISPSAYYAARAGGAAVVQTLHNFRLLCPSATFYRKDAVCEKCLGKSFAWPAIAHKCYRGSRAATATVATMLAVHRAADTWLDQVNVYLALTESARQKFIKGGFPAHKVRVKTNFIDPAPPLGSGSGQYAIFVGRLTPEKGIRTLLDAWKHLETTANGAPIPLKILGDGPLASEVAAAAQICPSIQWLGRRPHAEVLACLGEASFLVMPSQWYEGAPRVIVEAFATGTPVLASSLGAMKELIECGRTGRLFQPGDVHDLTAQVLRMRAEAPRFRSSARQEFETKYTAASNYRQLMEIYDFAQSQRSESFEQATAALSGAM